MSNIIENISLNDFTNLLNNLSNNCLIILRFTASWCKPCKNIDKTCEDYYNTCDKNIILIVNDIDESLDLYARLKRHKMINGIPALLAFYGNKKQDNWFIPNDIVNTGDIQQVASFFNRCNAHISSCN